MTDENFPQLVSSYPHFLDLPAGQFHSVHDDLKKIIAIKLQQDPRNRTPKCPFRFVDVDSGRYGNDIEACTAPAEEERLHET